MITGHSSSHQDSGLFYLLFRLPAAPRKLSTKMTSEFGNGMSTREEEVYVTVDIIVKRSLGVR